MFPRCSDVPLPTCVVLHFCRQGLIRDNQQKDRRARQQSRVKFSQASPLAARRNRYSSRPLLIVLCWRTRVSSCACGRQSGIHKAAGSQPDEACCRFSFSCFLASPARCCLSPVLPVGRVSSTVPPPSLCCVLCCQKCPFGCLGRRPICLSLLAGKTLIPPATTDTTFRDMIYVLSNNNCTFRAGQQYRKPAFCSVIGSDRSDPIRSDPIRFRFFS